MLENTAQMTLIYTSRQPIPCLRDWIGPLSTAKRYRTQG